ncbi:hypothetical protein PM082_015685 [Marasmius tenuissimus]|nr:hypothetical protein PM082_015685 [Marasmius tenuissimus]
MLPFILLLKILSFSLRFCSTAALRIEPPLPSAVTALRPVALTWIREPGDPEHFGFRKLPNGRPPTKIFTVFQDDNERGEFTLTFSAATPNSLVAINLDSSNRVTFFTGDSLIVLPATQTASSPTSPSQANGSNQLLSPSISDDFSGTPPRLTSRSAATTSSSPVSSTKTQPNITADPIVPATTSEPNPEIVTSPPPPTATVAESPQNPGNSKAIIVGSTVGGGFLLLLIILVLRYRRRIQVGLRLRTRGRRRDFGITDLRIFAPPSSSVSPSSLDGSHAETPGRGDLEIMERAFQGLCSQFGVLEQRMAQLESELAEQGPPDYTSNLSLQI